MTKQLDVHSINAIYFVKLLFKYFYLDKKL